VNSITRSDDLRVSNRRAVLRAVRREQDQSRTQLSELTGLSAATVSAICTDLIEEGILIEKSSHSRNGAKARGRPSVKLSPNPDAAVIAAVILSLNEVEVSLLDNSGQILTSVCRKPSTLKLSRSAVTTLVGDCLDKALVQLPPATATLKHIEVAFQGVTDVDEGVLLWSPILNHTGIELKKRLEARYAVSASIKNDCNMVARALAALRREELGRTFATLLFTHGIGMAIMHENKLISGTRSSATEFGHLLHQQNGALCRCGKRGCIEAYAADYAIVRSALGNTENSAPEDNIDINQLMPLIIQARNEDGPARQAFVAAGHAIGTGLGNLFTLLDCFPVALVGPITQAYDLMSESIQLGISHGVRDVNADEVTILCMSNDCALIRQGCIHTALDELDTGYFASRDIANV